MRQFGEKIYYNQTELASALGVTRQTIARKITQGIIPTEEVLGVRVIPGEFVEQLKRDFGIKGA